MMKIISVREQPDYTDRAIAYFQKAWPEVAPVIYQDCIANAVNATQVLPQWYLLLDDNKIIGGAGLITNDFISRMDLYPWLCALFIDEQYRNKGYSKYLVDHIKAATKRFGFPDLYLSTDISGYYEKLGFSYIGIGHHPWNESSKIYRVTL